MNSAYSYEHQLCKTLDLKGRMDWESHEYFEHRWQLLKVGDEVGLCLSRPYFDAEFRLDNLGLITYDTKYATVYCGIDDDYGFDEFQDYFVLIYCIKPKDSNSVFATTNVIDTHYKCWVDSIDRNNDEIVLSNGHGNYLKLTKNELFHFAWQMMCGGYKIGFPTF